MEMIRSLLGEYPFAITLVVMALSEFTKHLNEGFRRGVWFKHGGMPSSHSAFVMSLMMVVGTIDGLHSTTFAIATVFACIIWFDAAFVRSQVGRQARALNILQQFEEFSERVGHSVAEVAGGMVFGGLITYLLLVWIS